MSNRSIRSLVATANALASGVQAISVMTGTCHFARADTWLAVEASITGKVGGTGVPSSTKSVGVGVRVGVGEGVDVGVSGSVRVGEGVGEGANSWVAVISVVGDTVGRPRSAWQALNKFVSTRITTINRRAGLVMVLLKTCIDP